MQKTLIVAEKRSVGEAIASVIGADKKNSGFISGDKFIVSWAKGHLVKTARAKKYNDAYSKWNISDLPIIPDVWKFIVNQDEASKRQYDTLNTLMHSGEVNDIICATDAGREGELIFRLIYNQTGCKKPVCRLWISSLEEKSIRDGLAEVKPSAEYDNLYAAADARMKSDWIVGINLTRLYSCNYGIKLNVGRVQTPTINLIVERQHAIDNFIPQTYYSVLADCGSFKASAKVNDKRTADELISRCNGKDAYITKLEQKENKQSPPLLYDLTALQRDANRMFGYTAQQTLNAAQALYDNKLITYPRTDSRFITADMEQPASELIFKMLKSENQIGVDESSGENIKIDIGAIVNNSKVSDHHALLPTVGALDVDIEKLPGEQGFILKLIAWRLLCAVYPPHKYLTTKVYLDIEGEAFTATGKQTTDAGYTIIESLLLKEFNLGKETQKTEEDGNASLPALAEGDSLPAVKISSQAKQTKPLKPYTEDTLLSALEHAGSDIEDKELKDAIKGCGLGTPATRAGVIEKIIEQGFIERRGDKKTKTLHPTKIAIILMSLLPDDIKSAEMTAEWENKLSDIQHGKLLEDKFMQGIAEYVRKIITTSKTLPPTDNPFREFIKPQREAIGKCPRCGGDVYEGQKNFYCGNKEKDESGNYQCGFSMWKEDKLFTQRKKVLTVSIVKDLLACGRSVLKGCKPKDPTKSNYDINIFLDDTGTYVNYKWEFIKK